MKPKPSSKKWRPTLADLRGRYRLAVLEHIWGADNLHEDELKVVRRIKTTKDVGRVSVRMLELCDILTKRMNSACLPPYAWTVEVWAREWPRRIVMKWIEVRSAEKYEFTAETYEFTVEFLKGVK